RALELRVRLVIPCEEARIRVGAGVEQHSRGSNECFGARRIEPQKSRETEVRENVPRVRSTLRRDNGAILSDKTLYRRFVSENGGGVDVGGGDLGVCLENLARAVQRP